MFRRPSKRNQAANVTSHWIHFYKEYAHSKIGSRYNTISDAIRARRNDIDAYNYIMNALNLKLIEYDDNSVHDIDNTIILAFMYPAEYSKYFEDKSLITLLK